LALLAATLAAQTGALDPGFGSGGVVVTDFSGTFQNPQNNEGVNKVLVQPDGKVLAIGWTGTTSSVQALARYHPDGTPDSGFGTNGRKTRGVIAFFPVSASDAALQPDGSIVVVGSMTDRLGFIPASAEVTRFLPDGSIDTNFNSSSTGTKTVTFGSDQSFGEAVALQGDGRIVIAGIYGDFGGDMAFGVARLNADGTMDATFGTNGTALAWFPSPSRAWPRDVAIQPDGKIVVAGRVQRSNRSDVALARFLPNGTLDPAFGSGGRVETALGADDDEAHGVAVLPDGKIVVAGVTGNLPGTHEGNPLFLCYDPSGNPASGLSWQMATFPLPGSALSLEVAPDGMLLAGGYTVVNGVRQLAVYSLNPAGSVDATFGTDGLAATAIGSGDSHAASVALGPTGGVIAAGASKSGSDTDFALARFTFNPGAWPSVVRRMVWHDAGWSTALVTAFESGVIYRGWFGANPGGRGVAQRAYGGTVRCRALLPVGAGVYTAFEDGKITFSPDGFRLGGGGSTITVYGGAQTVRAWLPYQGGMLTSFSGGGVYFSPDGRNLGGGGATLRVNAPGGLVAQAMIPYQGGVLTAFTNGRITFSPDGRNLDGGGATVTVYNGIQTVASFVPYAGGVLTAFSGGGLYFSPDGRNLGGGGATVLRQTSVPPPVAMIPYRGGLFASYYNAAFSWVYFTPDGLNPAGGGAAELVAFGPPSASHIAVAPSNWVFLGNQARIVASSNGRFLFAPTQVVYP
jgi:uncharacterized delta-60 repeat protein